MKTLKRQSAMLPNAPGVYFFKDKKRKIIYIGKANNLRSRVRQYFTRDKDRHPKITALVSEIARVDWQECASGIDALIQEARLIKKHRPKFNVLLRDDKNYFFVGVSKENYPCVFITHQPAKIFKENLGGQAPSPLSATNYKLQANFIGPFTDGEALKQTLKILRRIFPYRYCRKVPKRICRSRELIRDFAPYDVPGTKAEIRRNIRSVINVLTGKKQSLLKKLERLMLESARAENYQLAEKYKNQLESLRNIYAHRPFLMFGDSTSKHDWEAIQDQLQSIFKTKKSFERVEGYDISNIGGQYAVGSMVVFVNGAPDKSQYRKFKIKYSGGEPNDPKMMAEIISRRLRHAEWPMPGLIIVDGGITQLNAAWSVLPKNQPVIALAKKQEEIYIAGKRAPLKAARKGAMGKHGFPKASVSRRIKPQGFREERSDDAPIPAERIGKEFKLFVQHLRDEAHRFAVTYHRKLRSKIF